MQKKPYYLQRKEEILAELNTSEKNGISGEEVQNRQKIHGKNIIEIKQKNQALKAFLKQFQDLLVLVLVASGILAIAFDDYQTGIILLLIVLINAVIGYVQEFQAEKIISKLSKLISPKTIVIRNSEQKEIDSAELVLGDIVILNEGDTVTADLRVLKSNKLQVNSFSITGESNPQHKTETDLKEPVEIALQTNMIFTGSQVAVGNGLAVVIATGMNSEFGKIAALTHETEEALSPLQEEINHLAKRAVILSVIVGSMMLFVGLYVYKISTLEAVIFALGLGAAMVPQGLPAEVNVALALGAKRLAMKNAVVRRLSSVETLGATTFICSDKTGTITKNEMTVEKIWIDDLTFQVSGLGYEGRGEIVPEQQKKLTEKQQKILQQFLECGFMSSNAKIAKPDQNHPTFYVLGDPTEGAIIALCQKGTINMKKEDEHHIEIAEIPFDSDRKMMSSIRKFPNDILVFSKGAPVAILNSVRFYRDINGVEQEITPQVRLRLEAKIKEYADQAYRVLAFAYGKIEEKSEYTVENTEKDLIFMGLIAIIDPPREGVQDAFEAAHNAHIKTIIITGDNPDTAVAIGKKIHLDEKTHGKIFCVTGADLEHINDTTLLNWLKDNKSGIFSRVSPEQKLRIVGLLKDAREIVAVTGDGVNDAPALKKAHIGIAMGKIGTEVAKEASQIILADDSFITLVSAIKEGRSIYSNLKKTITTCFTSNFGEFFAIVLGLIGTGLFGTPIALLAIHILLIDLFGEILPLMALTYDEPTSDLMTDKPRDINKHVLNLATLGDIILSGFFMGAAGYLGFTTFLISSGQSLDNVDPTSPLYFQAMTITYTTILVSQWWNVLLRRRGFKTVFNRYMFTNSKLWLSLLISLILVLSVIYLTPLHPYTKMAPLSLKAWGIVLAYGTAFMIATEIKKAIQRKVSAA